MEGAENESDINAKNMVAFGENNVERTKFWLTSIWVYVFVYVNMKRQRV